MQRSLLAVGYGTRCTASIPQEYPVHVVRLSVDSLNPPFLSTYTQSIAEGLQLCLLSEQIMNALSEMAT